MALTRIGLLGYGTGGQHFHAPFIDAADGVELAGVVTRSPERRAAVGRDWPGTPTYASLPELLAAGVDAVAISTPPETRRELVLEAVQAGVHVVADKPFAPTADAGRELAAAAANAGVLLTVFHNRRWDADIRTLAGVLGNGQLGDVWRVHSRMDFADPATLESGPGGGLLRDLGSHLVDQMLWLLGDVRSVNAHLDWIETPAGPTDASFCLQLEHVNGVCSVVESTKLNYLDERELRAYGSNGSYVARGTDVQAQAIFAGRRPTGNPEAWGYDEPARWGVLHTAAGEHTVPSSQGRYHDLYTAFGAAVRREAPSQFRPPKGYARLRSWTRPASAPSNDGSSSWSPRSRGKVVHAHVEVDPAIEVAVAGEYGHDAEVMLVDRLRGRRLAAHRGLDALRDVPVRVLGVFVDPRQQVGQPVADAASDQDCSRPVAAAAGSPCAEGGDRDAQEERRLVGGEEAVRGEAVRQDGDGWRCGLGGHGSAP